MSSDSSPHRFPSPIGGVAFPSDLAPSIIFAIMYGLLLPLLVYRIFNKKSRTMMLGGSLTFGIERIVIFSLRAFQSHDVTTRKSKGMNAYMQSTIAMGFVAICQDVVNLLRTALVNTTLPSAGADNSDSKKKESLESGSGSGSSAPSLVILQAVEVNSGEEDKPRQRFWYRRLSDLLYVGFLGAQVPGIIGNSDYANAVDKPSEATLVFRLRYVGSAIALFFSMALAATALWALARVPRFKKSAAYLTFFVCMLFSITSIYRLCVMRTNTTSLTSTAPGSQNTPGEKAAFYIFHILPEWISVLILLLCNVRDIFGTGMFGDHRFRDETQREKEIKEANELYKYDRKTGSGVGIYDEDFGMFAKMSHLWRRKE